MNTYYQTFCNHIVKFWNLTIQDISYRIKNWIAFITNIYIFYRDRIRFVYTFMNRHFIYAIVSAIKEPSNKNKMAMTSQNLNVQKSDDLLRGRWKNVSHTMHYRIFTVTWAFFHTHKKTCKKASRSKHTYLYTRIMDSSLE